MPDLYGDLTYGSDTYGPGIPVCSEYGVSTYGVAFYGCGLTPPVWAISSEDVRELPPLRLHIDALTPGGRHYRWGLDEPSPANVPRDLRFSTSMPGGFDSMDTTLPRKPGVDYSDLDRLSTLQVIGAGGEVAGEYRLERAPRTSGDQMSVSPGASGWQAHLEDDQSASEVYVDIDQTHWQEPSATRKLALIVGNVPPTGTASATPDAVLPSMRLSITDAWASPVIPCAETWYDAGPGSKVAKVYYDFTAASPVNTSFILDIRRADDLSATGEVVSSDLFAALTGSGYYTFATAGRCAYWNWRYNATSAGAAGNDYAVDIRLLAVFGNHGLTTQGTAPGGLYASDVIGHAVGTWAPLLNFSTGSSGSIGPSSFIIPQLEFREATTAAEIVKAANRFHLNDWAVWEDKTFYYHARGARGRHWRARIAPSQLSETGPQVDKLYNGVIVKYSDVDGSAKTVGPVGSGADTETSNVQDADPENPANVLGIRRWTQLDMGTVSTPAGAAQVGQIFIEQSKLLDSSGQAQLVGTVEDDKGIKRPAWQVRAGDYISFVDAADSSERRIVKTDYSHDSRTCSIDLDAPPEGMDALLERLGVVLVPLGL